MYMKQKLSLKKNQNELFIFFVYNAHNNHEQLICNQTRTTNKQKRNT